MIKGILTLGNATWNEKGRYKVNSAVNYNGSVYQNSTGGNSVPTLLVDWVLIKENALSTQISKFKEIYESGLQEFTLPDFAQIISVFVRGHRTENYTVLGNVITINNVIGSGSEVVILYLEDLATGIVPYYTQAQVDALISGSGGLVYNNMTSIDFVYSSTEIVNFVNGYWYVENGYLRQHLSFTITLNSASLGSKKNITITPVVPINDVSKVLGNGAIIADYSYTESGSVMLLNDSTYIQAEITPPSSYVPGYSDVFDIKLDITYKTT